MSFTVQFYADAPVVLLDCPQPLDFEHGLEVAQEEITALLDETQHVYLMINVHDIGIFFDPFVEQLKSWNDHRVTTMVITETAASADIPLFASIHEAMDYCYTEELRMVGD